MLSFFSSKSWKNYITSKNTHFGTGLLQLLSNPCSSLPVCTSALIKTSHWSPCSNLVLSSCDAGTALYLGCQESEAQFQSIFCCVWSKCDIWHTSDVCNYKNSKHALYPKRSYLQDTWSTCDIRYLTDHQSYRSFHKQWLWSRKQ